MRRSADQAPLERIARDFCVVLELHLLQDARPIGADGRHAEMEYLSNFRDRFPRRDKT